MNKDRPEARRERQRRQRQRDSQSGLVTVTVKAPITGREPLKAAARLMVEGLEPRTALRQAGGSNEQLPKPVQPDADELALLRLEILSRDGTIQSLRSILEDAGRQTADQAAALTQRIIEAESRAEAADRRRHELAEELARLPWWRRLFWRPPDTR